jgi:hypothetical protein
MTSRWIVPVQSQDGDQAVVAVCFFRPEPFDLAAVGVGGIIANVSETVAKALTSREWFREPGGHCIDCRNPFSPGAAP